MRGEEERVADFDAPTIARNNDLCPIILEMVRLSPLSKESLKTHFKEEPAKNVSQAIQYLLDVEVIEFSEGKLRKPRYFK